MSGVVTVCHQIGCGGPEMAGPCDCHPMTWLLFGCFAEYYYGPLVDFLVAA